MRDTHDTSQALIQVDISEKHTCVAQNKIQGAHWGQHWVSLSTVAIWHSGSIHSYVDMSCVEVFEMTSPEIGKRNEKMGLNKAPI